MPRKYSLTDKKIIEKCARIGDKNYTKYFIIKKIKSDSVKFAIVVSKKVSTKAIIRNRIRRQVKAVIKTNLNSIPEYNYLIVAKDEAKAVKFQEIKEDLSKIF